MLTFIYGDSLKEPPHLSQSLVMNDLVVIEFSVHSAINGTLLTDLMRSIQFFQDKSSRDEQSERQNISTILAGLSSLKMISSVDTFSLVTKKTESVSFIISSMCCSHIFQVIFVIGTVTVLSLSLAVALASLLGIKSKVSSGNFMKPFTY